MLEVSHRSAGYHARFHCNRSPNQSITLALDPDRDPCQIVRPLDAPPLSDPKYLAPIPLSPQKFLRRWSSINHENRTTELSDRTQFLRWRERQVFALLTSSKDRYWTLLKISTSRVRCTHSRFIQASGLVHTDFRDNWTTPDSRSSLYLRNSQRCRSPTSSREIRPAWSSVVGQRWSVLGQGGAGFALGDSFARIRASWTQMSIGRLKCSANDCRAEYVPIRPETPNPRPST